MAKFVIAFTFMAVVAFALARPQYDVGILEILAGVVKPKLGDGAVVVQGGSLGSAGATGKGNVDGNAGITDGRGVGAAGNASGGAGAQLSGLGSIRLNLGSPKTTEEKISEKIVTF